MFYHIFSSFKEQQKEKFMADYVNQLKTLQMLRDQEEHDQKQMLYVVQIASSKKIPNGVGIGIKCTRGGSRLVLIWLSEDV